MRLRVYQSLWAMSRLPSGSEAEWSVSEKMAQIVAAHFDGIDIAWTPTLPSAEAVRGAAE